MRECMMELVLVVDSTHMACDTRAGIHVHIRTHARMRSRMHAYIRTHARTHARAHTHTHTLTHTHIDGRFAPRVNQKWSFYWALLRY